MLFFCMKAISQKYNNKTLYEIEERGKELIGELKYDDAIIIFKSSNKMKLYVNKLRKEIIIIIIIK